MSDHAAAPVAGGAHGGHGHDVQAHIKKYQRVWLMLVALLAVSMSGAFLDLAHVHLMTMITVVIAFGVAVVKAYMVLTNFMHINLERRFIVYLVTTMLALMLLMFGGVAPDVLKHEGQRWENTAAKAQTARVEAYEKAHPSEHGEGGEKPAGAEHHEAAPAAEH